MFAFSELIIASLAIFVGIVYYYLRNRKQFYKNIPVPPTIPFFGNALDFTSTEKILPTMQKYANTYGGIVKVWIGPWDGFVLVSDYKMVEFILSSTTLLTKSENYQFLKPWLGSGLLIGAGPKWKKHRKILTPAFHFKILENFVDIMEACGDILIKKLEGEATKRSTDIFPLVTLCALDIICETTMGTKINAQELTSPYVHSVKEMCRIIMERSISVIQQYDVPFRFTKNYQQQKRAIQILHQKAYEVIKTRAQEVKHTSDDSVDDGIESKKKKVFLDILLEATVDGRRLTEEEIREEVDTFMFAGHDTTTSAVSFTLFCLANNPEVQQRVFEEQLSVFEDIHQPTVTYAHLQSMKYLENTIKESLRLYPSVPLIGRRVDEDLEYDGNWIPKRDTLLLFLFGIHRNPTYFKNPEVFDPDRFENADLSKSPYAFIPFSAGPRNCIGQKFAMLEMKSVISKIIRKFELRSTVPEHKLRLASETVLTSLNGIKVKLVLRS